jgi:hypothetical protein
MGLRDRESRAQLRPVKIIIGKIWLKGRVGG